MTNVVETKEFAKATFAGGCFWCMEQPFEERDGVIDVVSGYTGGTDANPTYKNYAKSGHVEAVEITYDPKKISYKTLLDIFWRQIDPTDDQGQFVDRGPQYTSAIFYHNDKQKQLAEQFKEVLAKSGRFSKSIVTPIVKVGPFYPAESYHQNYATEKPWRYKFYRSGSGRDEFLDKVWRTDPQIKVSAEENNILKRNWKDDTFVKPSDKQLRQQLTPQQYYVTQQNGTERAFADKYWNFTEPGIYVDVVSGEPLFSSKDKFTSTTGWPSFTQPLEPDNIVEREDRRLFSVRTEVRSKHADSHLGHVFQDGPPPTGLRYCINSAALRFVPIVDLEKEGYEKYASLFN